jgi:hypothetical protein
MNLNRKTKIRYPNIINLIELEHDSDISIEPVTESTVKIASDGVISLYVDGEYYGTHNKSMVCLSDDTSDVTADNDTIITLRSKSEEDIQQYIYRMDLSRQMILDYICEEDTGQPIEKNGVNIMVEKNDNGQPDQLIIKGGMNSFIMCDDKIYPFNVTLKRHIIY